PASESSHILMPLVTSLAQRLEPEQAAEAARQALDTLLGKTDLSALTCGQVLGSLAERLPPGAAAQGMLRLLDTLSRTNNWHTQDPLGEPLDRLAPGLTPDGAARVAPPLLAVLTRSNLLRTLVRFTRVAEMLTARLPAEDAAGWTSQVTRAATEVLVEMLKQP